MRNLKFETDKYYHICNRGADKRVIFNNAGNYFRFLYSMTAFNTPSQVESLRRIKQLNKLTGSRSLSIMEFNRGEKLVDVLAFCLMPNHFHILLKQLTENGVSKYMNKIQMGYANYFNLLNNRKGTLYQGRFRANLVDSDFYLWQTCCYINGNAEIHKKAKVEEWRWSSYNYYIGKIKGFVNTNRVLSGFSSVEEYINLQKSVVKKAQAIKDKYLYYLE